MSSILQSYRMEEQNKKTLIEALSSLPEHEPKEMLWEQIAEQMESGLESIMPQQLLLSLPQYEPPTNAWDGIAKQLDAQKPQAKIVKLGWRRGLAVAASLVFLLVAYWYFNGGNQLETNVVAVNFSEETVDPLLLQHDWDADEDAFGEFLSLCEAKKIVCEQPEFKLLQGELEELTAAKEELKVAIGEFSTDADLVIQIKEIELERNGVLKKMMAMLI
ncbi:MAG: hypothetical protein IPN76_10810 [Saprospiraceae bacterium]|nr:hypothetical protein [Saprospiraceae bacterium]